MAQYIWSYDTPVLDKLIPSFGKTRIRALFASKFIKKRVDNSDVSCRSVPLVYSMINVDFGRGPNTPKLYAKSSASGNNTNGICRLLHQS
jgi:hypothetical protein